MKPALVKLSKDMPLNGSIELNGWKLESEVPGFVSPLPLKPITWNGKEVPSLKLVPLIRKSYLRFFVSVPVFESYSSELKKEIHSKGISNFHISNSDPLISGVGMHLDKDQDPFRIIEEITNLMVIYHRAYVYKEDEFEIIASSPPISLIPVIEKTQPSFEE